MASLKIRKRNEHDAKVVLADSMNKLRERTTSVIGDLEGALEILQNIDRSLDEVPYDLDADSIDLDVIAAAVRGADDEGVEHIHVRSLQDEINRIRDTISEAVGQVEYLQAGDFDE